MADPVNDSLLNQVFSGEFCRVYIGSEGQTLAEYSAFISGFKTSGFNQTYTNERTMGTFITDRSGLSPGEVSFDVVFLGSIPNISNYVVSEPFSDYTEYSLTNTDKKFKIKIEFVEFASGSVGSPIVSNDYAYKEVYYNARGLSMSLETDPTKFTIGNVSFWVPPFTEKGSSNFRSLDKATAAGNATWGTRETAWDTENGWT